MDNMDKIRFLSILSILSRLIQFSFSYLQTAFSSFNPAQKQFLSFNFRLFSEF